MQTSLEVFGGYIHTYKFSEAVDDKVVLDLIRKASGETLDLKTYEADMRHLIDTYIEADEPQKISPFDDMPLLELIVKTGIADAINRMPDGIKSNREPSPKPSRTTSAAKSSKNTSTTPPFTTRCPPFSMKSSKLANRKPSNTRNI